jgi:hypothetical protein
MFHPLLQKRTQNSEFSNEKTDGGNPSEKLYIMLHRVLKELNEAQAQNRNLKHVNALFRRFKMLTKFEHINYFRKTFSFFSIFTML